MLTEQQIQDQQNYERKQIQGGLDKLRANTTKLEEKTMQVLPFMAQHALVQYCLISLHSLIVKKKSI